MKKDWIPYEVANELKQLGFDDKCIHHYKKNMEGGHSTIPTFEMNTPFGKNHNSFTSRVSAPTYSQAFRWFRDNGKVAEIFSQLLPSNKYKWGFKIQGVEGVTDGFFTYEEAELACLKKLIETIR
jgi:hypothetical protein